MGSDLGFFSTVDLDLDVDVDPDDDAPANIASTDRDATTNVSGAGAHLFASSHASVPSGTRQPPPPPPPPTSRPDVHAPTLREIEENQITKLAALHWSSKAKEIVDAEPLKRKKQKKSGKSRKSSAAAEEKEDTSTFDPELVEKIWNEELVASQFSLRKIMLLEFSQYLEEYLWPHYEPDTSGNTHLLSIVVMLNEKFRERVAGAWNAVCQQPDKFTQFFTECLQLLVNHDEHSIDLRVRRFLLVFLTNAFQSLDNAVVRSCCLRLVSIGTWRCLANTENLLSVSPQLRKAWNKSQKNLSSDQGERRQQDFEATCLSTLIKDFVKILDTIPESSPAPQFAIAYCERFLEFLIDLITQLPTRRYFNTVIKDHLVVELAFDRPLAKRGEKNRQIAKDRTSSSRRLQFYINFEIDDFTGSSLSPSESANNHYSKVQKLQKICFSKHRESLEEFALASVGTLNKTSLSRYFGQLEGAELRALCEEVGIRTRDFSSKAAFSQQFLRNVLVERYLPRQSQLEQINAMSLFPSEVDLFDDTQLPSSHSFTNTHCMPIPKLNLQFLTLHDYLLRNFQLFRLETSYEIRQDVEDVVKRVSPRYNTDAEGPDKTVISGWARMGVPLEKFDIVDIGPVQFGGEAPTFVKADLSFYVGKYTDVIRREWDSLRKHDVLFLVTIQMHPDLRGDEDITTGPGFCRKYGIKYVRGCEILDLLGWNGQPIDDFGISREIKQQSSRRSLRVLLDPHQYYSDMQRVQAKEIDDVYESLNLLIRRKPQENNFKAVLETIRDLMQSEIVVPDWLQDVFLGYGDPASVTRENAEHPVMRLDFRDTFLDWEHLKDSFPTMNVVSAEKNASFDPPYVLTFSSSAYSHEPGDDAVSTILRRKRKFSSLELPELEKGTVLAHTYAIDNNGPYLDDVPKRNMIRFTPTQINAIHSGMSPGLTLIVGPPGTGKTDVAIQTIANLYHNYPEEHTLLITHSNQALNQLFEKIVGLDIDPRHILRLGHGMDELEGDWGKYGRVNSFLEKRIHLLSEVERLVRSLGVDGAHSSSCETAGYFFSYHIQSRWNAFRHAVSSESADVASNFPFHMFFANAPQPLFPTQASRSEALEIAEGCYKHLRNIFDELEEIRAFELLRSNHDRSNYLLVKEAKIVALTCTHAAIKRRELVAMGFRYENVIMEEAAQILEVETFIPLLLQSPDQETGESRLKRVVMIGDHNQLPPVVKNMAFQRYGNMEQSMFARFIRLGVPTHTLDMQGRCRKNIADLFRWRYPGLNDLDSVLDTSEYKLANPGFAFDYQVVDVGDFNGAGETEPIPHFIQNLGEAEYVVATYQYMRLLGYPAKRIAILTTYNGQKALIEDVLEKRCRWNPLFGLPLSVSTVDKFQGQQSDYVLLSLVRTKTVGHLRDLRRLIVALSRARLGLYVFCRLKLFETCVELRPAFQRLLERPSHSLWLRGGEIWGSKFARPVGVQNAGVVQKGHKGRWEAEDADSAYEIADVAHMGAYVHQMIQEQVAFMREQKRLRGEAEAAATAAAAAIVAPPGEPGAGTGGESSADAVRERERSPEQDEEDQEDENQGDEDDDEEDMAGDS
ncbi:intron-binding protein aquarius [Zopfochytrium polystomum]|nr:intron-binding protein aquarius [Zopfochytrium polystomum]